ncbi:unnamed protein product [Adineta steineri]|nr:unnamed protein product [Adineta steineri]CAF3746661.1 unnamed protein product [Adineta steineri]
MNYLYILSFLFAVCLTASYGQLSTSTGRSTARQTVTTSYKTGTTPGGKLSCVCSCCSGLRCKPAPLQTFADSTCTTKSCQEKCKEFEPKHCNHSFMGTNDAYCTVKF